jgi:hypothetical protein
MRLVGLLCLLGSVLLLTACASSSVAHSTVPRNDRELVDGERQTFAPNVMRPGDVVTCDILDHRLKAHVPIKVGPGVRVRYNGLHIVSLILQVARHRDGTVTADCHSLQF